MIILYIIGAILAINLGMRIIKTVGIFIAYVIIMSFIYILGIFELIKRYFRKWRE